MTPKEWYELTIGKSYNTDNAYGNQCWDYIDYFKRHEHLDKFSTYCGLTKYAGDIWKLRYTNGASNYFEFIQPHNIKEGDWLFYDKHVAFYYNGREVGQNQIYPKNCVTSKTMNWNGLLGAFRYKYWTDKGIAEKFSFSVAGTYKTTANLNLRYGGNTNYGVITVIPKDSEVNCYGYYHDENGTKWLYVRYEKYTGFVSSKYLEGV